MVHVRYMEFKVSYILTNVADASHEIFQSVITFDGFGVSAGLHLDKVQNCLRF